jgi:hypothetical protein
MHDYDDDFLELMEPAYILFEGHDSGAFAFGCVTGQIFDGGDTDAVQFSWTGNDEMDKAQGEGWAELQPDGSPRAKSASTAAMRLTSSPAGRLLQQPARGVASRPAT